jgi:hypothetical protein
MVVVGGVHIVQWLIALEEEFMHAAVEMGIETVDIRVRGNTHTKDPRLTRRWMRESRQPQQRRLLVLPLRCPCTTACSGANAANLPC